MAVTVVSVPIFLAGQRVRPKERCIGSGCFGAFCHGAYQCHVRLSLVIMSLDGNFP